MKIIPLKKNEKTYSCNSYLILGDWNRVEDINTLIDPGVDGFVLEEIERLSTGCGKIAVEQVILTHNHFDHAAGVMAVKERYGSKVFACIDGSGVDEILPNGRFIKAGNDFLEVIHTPGHSSDSICLYAPAAKALFSGDTQLKIHGACDSYSMEYVAGIKKIAGRKIETIYSGHDAPVTQGCHEIILQTLHSLRKFADSSAGR